MNAGRNISTHGSIVLVESGDLTFMNDVAPPIAVGQIRSSIDPIRIRPYYTSVAVGLVSLVAHHQQPEQLQWQKKSVQPRR